MKIISVFIVCAVFILLPLFSTSQEISTVEEIYDFEIGDEFHRDGYVYTNMGDGNIFWLQIEDIIDKFYSPNNDTLFYNIYSQYSEFTDSNPFWTYHDTILTEFYTNLDLPINNGDIDSVYSDTLWFNGRLINSIAQGSGDWSNLKWFVNGCGQGHYSSFNLLPPYESESRLVYFNKNGEVYGEPITITKINKFYSDVPKLIVYPNPSYKRIFIKHNLENSQIQSIEIFNIQGKLVNRITMINEKNNCIEISKIPSGLYFLKLTTNSKTLETKFIKK